MTAASVTPRVRIMVICDEGSPSDTEEGVFTLEGVRQHVLAPTFPYFRDLNLFLLLSNPRQGEYDGWVRVVDNQSGKVIRYVPFIAKFEKDYDALPAVLEVRNCRFRQEGEHTFEIWFKAPNGQDVLKGELPFHVLANEE